MKPELLELLPDMVLFVAVAKAKSFSQAARALRMPGSTLSRRISELEARVGLQLLNRSTRKVELSDAGANYFVQCLAIVEAAEAAHAELKDRREHPRGNLKISATPDFALTFLTGLFADFARRYPEISFEFDLTPRSVDMVAESFDVAIRLGALADSQLTVRKLGWSRCAFYASTEYLAQAARLRSPKDLAQHHCLRIAGRGAPETSWTLLRGDEQLEVPVQGRFVANNMRFVLQLATLGMGVGVLDCAMAQPELDAKRLVRVLPEWSPPRIPVHALTPSKLMPARTRLFLSCLSDHLEGLDRG